MKTCTLVLTLGTFFSSGIVMAGESGNKADKFQELDGDKDGRVSRDEAQKSPHMAEKFDKLDANKDGYITQEEKTTAKAQWKADKAENADKAKQPTE